MEYYTHQKFLDFYLKITKGDILELGTGLGSAKIIDDNIKDSKRRVISVDNNLKWINKVKQEYPETDYRKYIYTENWEEILEKLKNHNWSVVFIDQAPWEARIQSYNALKDKAEYVIIHDVDYFPRNNLLGKYISEFSFDFSNEFKNWKVYYPETPWPSSTGPPTLVGTNKDKFIDYDIFKNFTGTVYRLPCNWFDIIPLMNRPINYLEIGVHYGANLLSVCDNYAKHPDSKVYGIDPWEDYSEYSEYKEKQKSIYDEAVKNIGDNPKINLIRGYSHSEVIKFEDEFFDMIYIDGNHEPEYVLEDAVLSFRKLKKGGYLIFDDYGWGGSDSITLGIDGFLDVYKKRITTPVFNDSQVFIQKLN